MASKAKDIKAPTRIESVIIRIMIIIGIMSIINLLYFFFKVEYRGYLPLYIMLAIILLYGSLKKFYLWYHYFAISVPKTPEIKNDFKVDILTTYFPGEPYEMILGTLVAIQEIKYPHTTYLCDEANDDFLKKECEKLGVTHVTRTNRINAKAGNINNALQKSTGDICVILDPDHIPQPDFLDEVLPYFIDEAIGYVQVVQAYHNKYETLVARGAAEQTFQFYGPMMMSMNSYGTVNAIGANCTFRRAALDSIGGHAPGLAEDMHTAMLLHSKGWKSVYVPKILAKGLAPADLTSYYKQQLKWSRGCFELLYKVYPKIFKNLTLRQKIHYGVLPLHYLLGFTYLLSFLIPIVSLLTSKMPWTGNILFFLTMSVPVFMSSLLIRTYIQKWVIEKSERGFHLIGGLLQIITWWVFLLGVVYTFIRKKVPYLPTPKDEAEETDFRLIIPNLVVGVLSIFAIVYGLYQDFSPFSLVMAFFALLNAVFMFFSLYLASKVTNRNRILRSNLEERTVVFLKGIKAKIRRLSKRTYALVRPIALPILIGSVYLAGSAMHKMESSKWETIGNSIANRDTAFKYLGIYNPVSETGLSELSEIEQLEKREHIDFRIISFYLAWGNKPKNQLPIGYLEQISENGSVPMITWEPWASDFEKLDSIQKSNDKILEQISNGVFDAYIKSFALELKKFKDPVFLRFAHEFDNPFYPWSESGHNTPDDFRSAWKHVYHIFKTFNVDNVSWVWNPWKKDVAIDYYPGDDYVDWVGLTILNYGSLNQDGKWYDFKSLYEPYHEQFKKRWSSKPIILAEFGSLGLGGNQEEWIENAFATIDAEYPEIKGVVLFNSLYDKNIPKNNLSYALPYLDWTFSGMGKMKSSFFKTYKREMQTSNREAVISSHEKYAPIPLEKGLRGIAYKKGNNWINNYDLADKQTLAKDFKQMAGLGINLIRYEQSKIYDYNVLKYSRENNLKVLYSFWIPETIDFANDKAQIADLKRRILKRIDELKQYKHIIGWNIGNDIWYAQTKKYDYTDLQKQQRAYFLWLFDLASEIKMKDSIRYLVKDISINHLATRQVEKIRSLDIPFDALGMVTEKEGFVNDFLQVCLDIQIPIIVNDIEVDTYIKSAGRFNDIPIIFRNWENQHLSDKITFDGLLDFEGRKKTNFFKLENFWNQKKKVSLTIPEIRILKPSLPLLSGNPVTYTALYLKDGDWLTAETSDKYRFEWRLIKNDDFGNGLAMKNLGSAPVISLKVPVNYENYSLMLTVVAGDISSSYKTTLNTPLIVTE